jgi:ketosteroid isomerase-like protein
MWRDEQGDDGSFEGAHVRAERLLNVPQALQRPRPGILIAGGGEVRTLALVARYADACSLRPGPEIPHKLDVLHRHCDEAGTDFERIERTCAFAFEPDDGGPATKQLIDNLGWLADLGIDTIVGRVDGDDPRTTIERLARHLVPAARDLGRQRLNPHTANEKDKAMNEITTFLSAWANAERKRDTTFLKANLTDDFVGVGPLGFQLPKEAWLARHRGNDLRYETFDLDELQVRTYGAAAIVTARQSAVGTYQGQPLPEVLRDTLVLVNEGEHWQLAGIHMSFVAGTPVAPPIPRPPAATPATANQGDH